MQEKGEELIIPSTLKSGKTITPFISNLQQFTLRANLPTTEDNPLVAGQLL
jgi:hypothetical protein